MKEYRITTGDLSFGERFTMGGTVTMRDEIDREILERAINIAAARLPFMATELVSHDGSLYLRENGKPFIVSEGENPPPLGSEEANGHEFSFSCRGHRIYFLYNHAVCDGHGYAMVNGTVIRSYCRLRYGISQDDGPIDLDKAPDGEEYADPFSFVTSVPAPPAAGVKPPLPFMPPAEDFANAPTLINIKIPRDDLLERVRSFHSSPAPFLILLLCRAFYAVYPDRAQPIMTLSAADVRRVLGCEKTAQNCVAMVPLFYTEEVRPLPVDQQAARFRQMLRQQLEPEAVQARMGMLKQAYELKTAQRRADQPTASAGSAGAAVVFTYAGRIDRGALEEYSGELRMETEMVKNETFQVLKTPATVTAMEEKGVFSMDIMYAMKTPAVYEAFLRELDACAIPYTADPVPAVFSAENGSAYEQ